VVNDRLWWRWSWRDLRGRWGAVATIAAVIAIGTGVYSGLGSTAAWREQSNDRSFAALRMHDLRAELSPGTFATEGELQEAVRGIEHSAWIERVDERLVVESSIDATVAAESGGDVILVMARLVGAAYGDPGVLDDRWVARGTGDGVVLELKFADYYGLPPSGSVDVAGGETVRYSGLGVAPEEFYVLGPEGSILAQADVATLYLPLAEAQRVTGRADAVNDVALTLTPTADRAVVETELEAVLAGSWSASVTTRDEAEAYRILYEDIDNDQQMWNALSALVLGAAALASFNLISRIVEAQRREIGIGMALGVARARLAIRPVLVGVQVGVIGTLAGIGVAALLGAWMRGLMQSLIPMPIWVMPFQFGVFARGALFGLVPPLLAATIPVWRALRVEPIEAIRSGHLARAGGRLGGWARRLRVPGGSLAQMPLRNLVRSPRRTLLTALGVGAAITALVAVLGMLDSFKGSIDRGAAEVTRGNPIG
jgi:putative ABC transport system permease protein